MCMGVTKETRRVYWVTQSGVRGAVTNLMWKSAAMLLTAEFSLQPLYFINVFSIFFSNNFILLMTNHTYIYFVIVLQFIGNFNHSGVHEDVNVILF